MKSTSAFVTWFAVIVAAMAVAGCATPQEAEHNQHHPGTTTAPTAGVTSPGAPAGPVAMMDMKDVKAMCEMHKKMMSGKTPEQQRAMMDERMTSMSPEMMSRHMAIMQECK